jgi:poly-gamma-glutamate system protein
MNRLGTRANPVLGVILLLSLLAFLAVEASKIDVKQKWYSEKLAAARHAQAAAMCIKEFRLEKGVFIDEVNDPNETALIGQEVTPITTDRGDINAKLATTNPNFAAVVVDLLKQAGLKEGDHVAVAMTGSFPGLNVSVFAALETMKLSPIVITSVGSSNWGANDPYFTWLDMERVLSEAKVFHTRSVAASVGGGSDIGRGLSPEGREFILAAIRRNGAALIREDLLEKSVERRLELYEKHSKGKPLKAYINVGGGIASLGATVNGEIIPGGLSKTLSMKNFPARGVIVEMVRRGIPIIHLYNVQQIGALYGLPSEPVPLPEPGSGGVFSQKRYNVPVTLAAAVVLLGIIVLTAYVDRRRHRLGTELAPSGGSELENEL